MAFKKPSATPLDDSFFYFYTRTQNQYVMLNKTPFVKLHGFGGQIENETLTDLLREAITQAT